MAEIDTEAQGLSIAARKEQELRRRSAAHPEDKNLRVAAATAQAEVGGRVQAVQGEVQDDE